MAFRGLFCVIFLGLGGEHLFQDELIRLQMPAWVPWPRAVSILVGLWLVGWGGLILLGFRLRWAAIAHLLLCPAALKAGRWQVQPAQQSR
ncbi:MAG: hypothetical protein O7C73_07740 [Nitrospirae bacterium]|nr:hypothetical protein [Nitrospirota bacterium]